MTTEIDMGNKYIHARELPYEIKGKPAFAIINKSSGREIACIGYYPAWRQYVMYTDAPAVFNNGCLESITKFITEKNRE